MTSPKTADQCRAEAEWLARLSTIGTRVLVLVGVLALVFTMINVQQFASQGHQVTSFHWWIAWLLDPMAAITMAAAIVFEWTLASYDRREGWVTATKWFAGGATLAMNVWSSVADRSPSGVVLYLVAPGLLLFLAEAAPRVRRHFTAVIAELLARAEHLDAPAPAPAPAAPAPVAPAPVVGPPAPARLTPAVAAAAPVPRSAPAQRVPADLADLVRRARELPQLPGREKLAAQLGCNSNQARRVLEVIHARPVAA